MGLLYSFFLCNYDYYLILGDLQNALIHDRLFGWHCILLINFVCEIKRDVIFVLLQL